MIITTVTSTVFVFVFFNCVPGNPSREGGHMKESGKGCGGFFIESSEKHRGPLCA